MSDSYDRIQFHISIDRYSDPALYDFLLFVRKNRKFNSVIRKALKLYMANEQYDLFTPLVHVQDSDDKSGK